MYILKSLKNGSYYIGISKYPFQRLEEHNKGYVRYTRNLTPWNLVFIQRFESVEEARRVERALKKLKRKDILERIVKEGFIKKHIGV